MPQPKNININVLGDMVTLSFTLRGEAASVASISYKIAVNDYDYFVFVDEEGTSRSHTFNMKEIGKSITNTSIVNAAIGIQDIDGNITYSKIFQSFLDDLSTPSICNLSAAQRRDGSGLVDIWYDYNDDREISPASVTLLLYKGEVALPTSSASGDIGSRVLTGQNRHIVWNPAIDAPDMEGGDFSAKIVLSDEDEEIAGGDISTGSFVVDATKPNLPIVVFKKANEQARYGVTTTDDLKNRTIEI